MKMNKTPNYKELIKDMLSKHYNVLDKFKDNTVEQNRAICEQSSLPFGVGIYNVLGDLNVGIMIRTASLVGARKIALFGRKKYDQRSTVGAENYIDIEHFVVDDTVSSFRDALIWSRYYPIYVELGGHPICPDLWDWIAPYRSEEDWKLPMFVFGSESDGFGKDLTSWINFYGPVISIPQRGVLRSFNVSSAMSIITYEYSQYVLTRMKWREQGYP
jgi:tRNA G18 (ribose-2'-O)-methylase SpoU